MLFSKDSRYLWVKYGSSFYDNEFCKWDIKKGVYLTIPIDKKIKNRIKHYCSYDDNLLVNTIDGKAYIVNEAGNIKEISFFNEPVSEISSVNDSLYCVSTDKSIHVFKSGEWDKSILSYPLDFKYVKHIATAGSRIAALYSNDTIVVYNMLQRNKEKIEYRYTFDNHLYYDRAINFSKDGELLFALDGQNLIDINFYNGNLRFWDFPINYGRKINNKHGKIAYANGKIIVSDANIIKTLAPKKKKSVGEYNWNGNIGYGHSSSLLCNQICQNDSLLFNAVANWDFEKNEYKDIVIVISNFDKQQKSIVYGHRRSITSLYYDDNHKNLYSCSLDSTLQIYNLTNKQQREYKFTNELTCLFVNKEKCYIGDASGNIHLLINEKLKKTVKLLGHCLSIITSDENGNILIGDQGGNIVLLDSDLHILESIKYSNSEVTSLIADKYGNIIAGQRDGWVRVFNSANLNFNKHIKLGEQIAGISLNNIGQIAVTTIKHGYSDNQSATAIYVFSNELLPLFELKDVTAPSKLWWLSDYELIGTNGIKFFTWKLPQNALIEFKPTNTFCQ